MKQGQDTLMPNWALDAMASLTLAADIRTLVFLTRHRAYRSNTYTTKQVAIALELDIRTAQASTTRLAEAGLILSFDGVHCSKDAASRTQAPRKVSAKTLQKDSHQQPEKPVQDVVSEPLNKGADELKKFRTKKKNPPTPRGGARQSTAPVQARSSTPFQEVFGALAETCYGGTEGLTTEATGRIGSAAKSLIAAGYQPDDVTLIAAWIRKNEKWRSGPIAPQTLSERAPAWRQGMTSTALPKANELDSQDWAAEAAEADKRNRFLDAGGWN